MYVYTYICVYVYTYIYVCTYINYMYIYIINHLYFNLKIAFALTQKKPCLLMTVKF